MLIVCGAVLVNRLNAEQMPATVFAFEFDGTVDFNSCPLRGGNVNQPRFNGSRVEDRVIDAMTIAAPRCFSTYSRHEGRSGVSTCLTRIGFLRQCLHGWLTVSSDSFVDIDFFSVPIKTCIRKLPASPLSISFAVLSATPPALSTASYSRSNSAAVSDAPPAHAQGDGRKAIGRRLCES